MRSLNRANKASFLSTGADCCQVHQLGHVKKQTSYFYRAELYFYIKRLSLYIWNPAAAETRPHAREAKRERTADQVLSCAHSGHRHMTWNPGLNEARHSSFIALLVPPGFYMQVPKSLVVFNKKMILQIKPENAYIQVFHWRFFKTKSKSPNFS